METRKLSSGDEAASIGPLYIIYFSGTHINFRLAEFRAAADYLDIAYAFLPLPYNRTPWLASISEEDRIWRDAIDSSFDTEEDRRGLNVDRQYMLVHLPSDEVVRQICQRVTCIRSVWQHWASGRNLEEVREGLQREEMKEKWMKYWEKSISWRATVLSARRKLTMREQVQRMDLFKDLLDFQGPIKMKGAILEWGYLEEWTVPCLLPLTEDGEEGKGLDMSQYHLEVGSDAQKQKHYQKQRLIAIHIGRKVADGVARDLVPKMDVKKRKYIGNTTMEAQMSLIQAGMALSGPGKLILDPFAGTCSLLLAAAVLGAHVVASDIDGRMMRGKAKAFEEVAVLGSARQYGVEDKFMGFICSDISQHPWKGRGIFDSIIADPPYGVRAGAKQLGKRDVMKQRDEPYLLPDGTFSHQRDDYFPPTKPYALNNLLVDLMNFSSNLLVPKGRLVFWMPTMIESVETHNDTNDASPMQELQLDITPDFTLIAHSLQDYGVWGRRLITLEKVEGTTSRREGASAVLPSPPAKHHGRILATDDPTEFRNKFIFRKTDGIPQTCTNRQDPAAP